ncbi:MAG: hypothetical protein KKB50_05060 [Planctomycetes bacterium]|nr:hypothetical protein [Planctomycetota bacterium]
MVTLPKPNEARPPSNGCGALCIWERDKKNAATAVRYGALGWIGEFSFRPTLQLRCGTKVVVQTDRGIELGQQVSLVCPGCDRSVDRDKVSAYVDKSGPESYRQGAGRILREATRQDLDEHTRLNAHIAEDLGYCSALGTELALDMKIITAEHLLGGEQVVFYFRAESRVDFRQLVKELAHRFQTRIVMRQVGARDEARLVGDYEVCGRECCCKNFLKKLRPVSMKMAKLQKSTLDPSKVSGRCGRLRCCLRYEHEGYEALAARLPRLGSRVATDKETATVVATQILTQLILLRTDEQREIAVPLEEIREFNLPKPKPAVPAPPAAPDRSRPLEDSTPIPTEQASVRAPEQQRQRLPAARGPRQRRSGQQTDGAPAQETARGSDGKSAPFQPTDAEADAPQTSESTPAPAGAEPAKQPRRRSGRRRRRRKESPDTPPANDDR